MNEGYIKTWRKCLDSGMLKNKNLWAFWSWCLLKASYKKRKKTIGYQEIILEPGQFVFSRKMASAELCMTDREIRTCMASLENSEKVTIKSTNKFSIITIINWGIYQSNENENDQQNDQRPTNNRPTTSETYKEDKIYKKQEGKEGKENNTPISPKNLFDEFWEAYPRKVSKQGALKSWEKINPDEQLFETIISKVEQYKKTDQWIKDGGNFIPHPKTWLNQKRWEDEICTGNIQKPPSHRKIKTGADIDELLS